MSVLLIVILLFLICFDKTLFADTGCDDWVTYNNEKCVKLFDTSESFDAAMNTCNTNSATLVTITSSEEQRYIENYLFATHSAIENVWTGLKYSDSKYKWLNGVEAVYTNWAEGSPKHNSSLCIQIDSYEPLIGKWSDISCTKGNLALCQKSPTISIDSLYSMLITTRTQLESKVQQLTNRFEFLFHYFHYKTFTDNSDNRKALIIPYKSMNATPVLRSDAVEICRRNNATLVDIESVDKQKVVEAFFYQLQPNATNFWYWTGGYRDASNYWRWMGSNATLGYTNWSSSNYTDAGSAYYTYIYLNPNKLEEYGKWKTTKVDDKSSVFCELSFN